MRVPSLLGLRHAVLAPALVVAAVPIAGCGDGDNHWHSAPGPGVVSSTVDSGTSPVTPLLVDVDPNKTLTATPGEGVGIFIEYQTGGHWNIWWTCDTNKTGLNCLFDIQGSIASGALANVAAQSAQPSDTLKSTATTFEATTTTTTGIDGVTFDAPLGAIVTLTATIGGLQDGAFFFFVQNGEVNGGYTGALTDPLEVEASSP